MRTPLACLWRAGVGAVIFLSWLTTVPARAQAPVDPAVQFAVERRDLADGVFAFVEDRHAVVSGNMTVVVGRDAALVFDAGYHPAVTRRVIDEIKRLTPKPVRYLVLSHWHHDHWTGAAEFADAFPGIQVLAHPFTAKLITAEAPTLTGALCRADFEPTIKTVREMLATGKAADGTPLTPARRQRAEGMLADGEAGMAECDVKRVRNADRLIDATTTIDLGGRAVRLEVFGPANTAGDLVAVVPDAKIAMAGDIVVHPFPFATQAYIPEWARALRRLEALSPAIVVPGHGEPQRDLAYVRLLASTFESIERQAKAAWTPGMTEDALRQRIDLSSFREAMAHGDPVIVANFDAMVGQLAVGRMWQALTGAMKPEGREPSAGGASSDR